ncbi:hypothetical protein J5X84_36235 [Streptosporangiaceae bacterium NEAU-GS5]|nr:hypothetical protein [Streptosporangiaceae bacterium NEAU-GS5]
MKRSTILWGIWIVGVLTLVAGIEVYSVWELVTGNVPPEESGGLVGVIAMMLIMPLMGLLMLSATYGVELMKRQREGRP